MRAIAHISAQINRIRFFFQHTKCQLAQVIIFSVTEKCVYRRDLVLDTITSSYIPFKGSLFSSTLSPNTIQMRYICAVYAHIRLKETHLERNSLMMEQHGH